VPFKSNRLTVGASFGIAPYPDDGDVAKTLIKKADEAMYMSKRLGKNRYTFAVEEENVSL
jgi:diguanylate cyclase (GGDEF)-like protein